MVGMRERNLFWGESVTITISSGLAMLLGYDLAMEIGSQSAIA
jgi:hypothetical protein